MRRARGYFVKGDFDNSLKYDNKALSIQKKLYANDHFIIADSYYNIARNYSKKALEIQLNMLEDKHPGIGSSYLFLATAHLLNKYVRVSGCPKLDIRCLISDIHLF